MSFSMKGWILCQEEMEQVLAAKGPVRDVVWAEARVKAGWVDRLLQGRAEIVCVRNVEQRHLMLRDSRVIRQAVLNVVQKWQEVNLIPKCKESLLNLTDPRMGRRAAVP